MCGVRGDIKGLKMGVGKEYVGEGVREEGKEWVLEGVKVVERVGGRWEEV